jgi:hypothetical protein
MLSRAKKMQEKFLTDSTAMTLIVSLGVLWANTVRVTGARASAKSDTLLRLH